MGAANRDPLRFPNPDELDLTRADNRHVAFGWAAHYCFGAPLARMEGAIAFNTLLRRLKELSLADEKPTWRGNTGLRGLTALQVSFVPGARVAGTSAEPLPLMAASARCPFAHERPF
jgi:cytochrome P450